MHHFEVAQDLILTLHAARSRAVGRKGKGAAVGGDSGFCGAIENGFPGRKDPTVQPMLPIRGIGKMGIRQPQDRSRRGALHAAPTPHKLI